jgi:hypothetical protein
VAAIVRPSFVFSPGIALLRADVEDYGTFLGLSLPFEWVTNEGIRLGFEVDIGRAFGGEVHSRCGTPPCNAGPESSIDRPSRQAFYAHFQFGWGFNHPPARVEDAPETR